MTHDDIIRMAREAGCGWAHNGTEPLLTGETQIERFAALVAAAEREACAKLCEDDGMLWGARYAAKIRARGEK